MPSGSFDRWILAISPSTIHERCDSVVPINHRSAAHAGEDIAKDAGHDLGSDDYDEPQLGASSDFDMGAYGHSPNQKSDGVITKPNARTP